MSPAETQHGHKQVGRWIVVPLADLITPRPGRICYGPRWWKVTDNSEVLFFDSYCSPQCNTNKTIVEKPSSAYDQPPTTPQFIEMAFIPHDCRDYA